MLNEIRKRMEQTGYDYDLFFVLRDLAEESGRIVGNPGIGTEALDSVSKCAAEIGHLLAELEEVEKAGGGAGGNLITLRFLRECYSGVEAAAREKRNALQA